MSGSEAGTITCLCLLAVLRVRSLRQSSTFLPVGRVVVRWWWLWSGGISVWCRSLIMPKDVLNNTGNDYEFVGNFRPPKRSTGETIKLLLYNREAGTVLGRTGSSWGKNLLCIFCNLQYMWMILVEGLLKL